MDRPTKEQVDGWLDYQSTSGTRQPTKEWKAIDAFAAEVRALRAEYDALLTSWAESGALLKTTRDQLTELRAAVEAVRDGANLQTDVSDCIAYVDNEALKSLLAVLAKGTAGA
jgi:hypothetical protein